MANNIAMEGVDLLIEDLIPLNTRTEINLKKNQGFKKIVASIKAIGLIEPLYVFPENEKKFTILDGYLRYKACENLGIKNIPCLVHKEAEAYTFNRMVNPLGNYQEQMMLRRALEEIDAKTVAETFGLSSLSHRLSKNLIEKLHPDVVEAYKTEEICRQRAKDLSSVVPSQQISILGAMRETKDYSKKFIVSQLLSIPLNQRVATFKQRVLWAKNSEKKKQLVNRLQDAQEQQSFYSTHYRDYCTNIMKLVPFIRQLISEKEIASFLENEYSEIYEYFNLVISEEQN